MLRARQEARGVCRRLKHEGCSGGRGERSVMLRDAIRTLKLKKHVSATRAEHAHGACSSRSRWMRDSGRTEFDGADTDWRESTESSSWS